MGINVSPAYEVFYDDTHQNLVSTCVKSNPTTSIIKKLEIHNIFERRKSLRGDQSQDGNPLIYALKKQKKYTISSDEVFRFMPSFYEILDQIAQCVPPNSIIIPMPSSHRISLRIATRLQRRVCGGSVMTDTFSKITCEEAYLQLRVAVVPKVLWKDRNRLLSDLKVAGADTFSMKQVKGALREYINPLRLLAPVDMNGGDVWLVDDLVSSGQTLVSAALLLGQQCHPARISAIGLLGSYHHANKPFDPS